MLFDPPPPYVVSFQVVVAGSVESFDKAAFAANLAGTLGVDESTIALDVSAASVNVLAQYGVTDFSDAQGAFDILGPLLSNETMKQQLACALGLCGQILSVSALEMIMSQSAPEPGDGDAVGGEHGSGSGSGVYFPPTPPSTPPTPPPPPPKDEGLGTGAVAGIVVGVLLGIAALATLAVCLTMGDRKVPPKATPPAPDAPKMAAAAAGYDLVLGNRPVGMAPCGHGRCGESGGCRLSTGQTHAAWRSTACGRAGSDFVVTLR